MGSNSYTLFVITTFIVLLVLGKSHSASACKCQRLVGLLLEASHILGTWNVL